MAPRRIDQQSICILFIIYERYGCDKRCWIGEKMRNGKLDMISCQKYLTSHAHPRRCHDVVGRGNDTGCERSLMILATEAVNRTRCHFRIDRVGYWWNDQGPINTVQRHTARTRDMNTTDHGLLDFMNMHGSSRTADRSYRRNAMEASHPGYLWAHEQVHRRIRWGSCGICDEEQPCKAPEGPGSSCA